MKFNIFEPKPVIFRSDNSNLLEHFPSIPIDPNKCFSEIRRGEVYALLPTIPTSVCGNSFLVLVKASNGVRLHSMSMGQLGLLIRVFSKWNVQEEDAQALGQVLIRLGFNLRRYDSVRGSFHDRRLAKLRECGYFDIESRSVVNIGLDRILEKAFNH